MGEPQTTDGGRQFPGYQLRPVTAYCGCVADLLLRLVQWGCLALQLWAAIDCLTRGTQKFVVAEKLTKPAWAAITIGAAFITFFFGALNILGIAGLIASIVYLVDVRPAIKEISGGSRW